MEPGDVSFEFGPPEFGILLLALFLIYGITWFKDWIEARLQRLSPVAAAAGAEGGDAPADGVDRPPPDDDGNDDCSEPADPP